MRRLFRHNREAHFDAQASPHDLEGYAPTSRRERSEPPKESRPGNASVLWQGDKVLSPLRITSVVRLRLWLFKRRGRRFRGSCSTAKLVDQRREPCMSPDIVQSTCAVVPNERSVCRLKLDRVGERRPTASAEFPVVEGLGKFDDSRVEEHDRYRPISRIVGRL